MSINPNIVITELSVQLEISNKTKDDLIKQKHKLQLLKTTFYKQITQTQTQTNSICSSNTITDNKIILWIFPSFPSSKEILKSSDYSILLKLYKQTQTQTQTPIHKNKLTHYQSIITYKHQLQRAILDDILDKNKKQKKFKQQLKLMLEKKKKLYSELQKYINELKELRQHRIIELLNKFKSSIDTFKTEHTTPLTPLQIILNDIEKLNDIETLYYFDTSRIKEHILLIKNIKTNIKANDSELKNLKHYLMDSDDRNNAYYSYNLLHHNNLNYYPILYCDDKLLNHFETIITKAYITKLSKSVIEIDNEIKMIETEMKMIETTIQSISNDIKNIKYSNEWRRLMRFQQNNN